MMGRDYENTNGRCCHRCGGSSLLGLIFGIVSFSVTLAFRIVGVVLQALFGVLSGFLSGSQRHKSTEEAKGYASYTINDIKEEAAAEKKKTAGRSDSVRESKKPEEKMEQATAEAQQKDSGTAGHHSKDIYIFLFIMTIIPATVALAAGKLIYAGAIGAAGIGLMLITGVLYGIAGSIRKRQAEQQQEKVLEEDEEKAPVEKLIKEAFEKLFEIRKDIDKVKDETVRKRMEAICSTAEKIIGEVRTNPEGLGQIRKFFYYYLDAFGEIVKKYLRLSNFEESSEDIAKLVAETENAFDDIDGIFKDLCEKLLEKDMMHLKAEINVIKNSI